MKKGFVITFKLRGAKSTFSGVVLDYNENWILIRKFYDLELDGYFIFRNFKSTVYIRGEREKMMSKILKVRQYDYKKDIQMPAFDLDGILVFISNTYKLVQVNYMVDDSFDVLKYLKKEGSDYLFKELTSLAKWRYDVKLPSKDLSVIGFGHVYLNTLKLIMPR